MEHMNLKGIAITFCTAWNVLYLVYFDELSSSEKEYMKELFVTVLIPRAFAKQFAIFSVFLLETILSSCYFL